MNVSDKSRLHAIINSYSSHSEWSLEIADAILEAGFRYGQYLDAYAQGMRFAANIAANWGATGAAGAILAAIPKSEE